MTNCRETRRISRTVHLISRGTKETVLVRIFRFSSALHTGRACGGLTSSAAWFHYVLGFAATPSQSRDLDSAHSPRFDAEISCCLPERALEHPHSFSTWRIRGRLPLSAFHMAGQLATITCAGCSKYRLSHPREPCSGRLWRDKLLFLRSALRGPWVI